jgi:cobalt-zinc-cadmium efflux system outer membrane protein
VQIRARTLSGAYALVLLLVVGCRSVDPGPDYDRAGEEIRRATGSASVFHPDAESEQAGARVTALLEGGLELTEAVELGLLNSPLLQASFHSVGMASADRAQAGLLRNPSLSAVLRFPTSGGATEIEGGLFASLLDIWQVPDRERVAEQALEQRILQLAHEAVLLAAEIRVAYIGAVSAQRTVEIAMENRSAASSLVELAEARLEAAATTAIDTNLARLEQAATAIALRDAELASGEAARRLKALLGLRPDFDLVVHPLPEWTAHTLPPVEELERIAAEERLDVRAAEAALKRAGAELERQRHLVWQKLDVGVGAEKDGDWSLGPGASLELPLFDQNQAQIARALEDTRRREKILAATTIAAVQEVRSADARVRAAADTLSIYRDEVLVRAEETLEQARSSYQLGKTTILPVIEAQRQVLDARQNYVRRLEQAATALSDVERATGTPRETLFGRSPEGEREP